MTAVPTPGQWVAPAVAANSAIEEAMAGLATVAELPVEAHYEALAVAHGLLRSVLDDCATG